MPESMHDTLWRSLPAIYRAEGTEGLTYRLLGVFSEQLERVEDEVLRLHAELNPDTARSRFLPWLASWVALLLDETWSETKRRALIRSIVGIYKRRGTPGAIKELVAIYTGYEPEIIEHYRAGWQVGVTSTVGVDTRVYGGDAEDAHRFTVIVYTTEPFDAAKREKIRAVVLREKPSWTQLVAVIWFQDIFWRVGVRSTVGMDTIVG